MPQHNMTGRESCLSLVGKTRGNSFQKWVRIDGSFAETLELIIAAAWLIALNNVGADSSFVIFFSALDFSFD